MLRNAKDLHGFTIRATDGDIGTVDAFYFDDESWAIRYFTVETGGWLDGRLVLISPICVIGKPDWGARRLHVSLRKKQVENSPDVDTHKPVSRQHEIEYLGYYGYPFYWGGASLWGSPDPEGLAIPMLPLAQDVRVTQGVNMTQDVKVTEGINGMVDVKEPETRDEADSHLRSAQAVTGYYIEATDGEIGHLDGLVFDDETWAIRYIEVATRNWWPGKKVLVSPAWIEQVSWEDSKVYVKLTRETIQTGPGYVESLPITRDYERRLYSHYGRPPYWLHASAPWPSMAGNGV